MQMLLIATLGLVGIFGRFFVDRVFVTNFESVFPFSTFVINLVGSFLIGFVFVISQRRDLISPELSTALVVGLLGGFTTFSAFSMQSLILIQNKQYALALPYFVGSPCLGLLCASLGFYVGGQFTPGAGPS